MELVVTLFLIAITIIEIAKIYKEYKEYKKPNLEMLFWLIVIIVSVPIIIYYVDRSNFLSKYNWFENSNSDRWFSFITTYISSVFAATIGAVALILMTRKEINVIRKNDVEQRRIANLPLLKYSADFMATIDVIDPIILSSIKNSEMISIRLDIKNIGMNAMRDCRITKIKYSNGKIWNSSIASMQNAIEKNELVSYFICFPVQKKATQLTVVIRYQDILSNWYEQEVDLDVNIAFPKLANTMKTSGSIKITTKKEKITKKVNKE